VNVTLNVPSGFQAPSSGEAPTSLDASALVTVRGEVPLSLELRHGGQAEVSVPYELAGPPGAPLLIVAGGISAGRHVLSSAEFPDAGWWQAQTGSLDQRRHRILSFDWLGADGLVDATIDPADQATVAVRLLAELGLGKAAAFIGASYGGMVGMHVAADHPHSIGALLAISAAARPHPYSSACRALQRRAVALGEFGGDPAAGVALARALAMLTYRTPEEFADRFTAEPDMASGHVRVAAEAYLDAHGERHCRRMSATAYRRLSESIDIHRIDPSAIAVPLTLAGVDTDALVPAAEVRALAEAVPGSRFHLIQSRYGHDAFLKEDVEVAAIITEFLDTLECAQ
jgi:homoserine O-acetyltransferase